MRVTLPTLRPRFAAVAHLPAGASSIQRAHIWEAGASDTCGVALSTDLRWVVGWLSNTTLARSRRSC
jgi:hypothetical protein